MGSRAFGGATTRYARIRLIATIPWMRERSRGAVRVKALRPLRGGRCPALTQPATASGFCLRLSGNGSEARAPRRHFSIPRRATRETAICVWGNALPQKRTFRAKIYTVSMEENVCRYCIHKFRPSRYHPDQKVCSSGDCQRRRRTDYHRKKLVEDPVYREQCRDSQKKWREKNPHYMKRYWADRRAGGRLNAKKSNLTSELRQLLKMVKNNSAVDLRSLDASIWLVSPDGLLVKRTTLLPPKSSSCWGFRTLQARVRSVKNISLNLAYRPSYNY